MPPKLRVGGPPGVPPPNDGPEGVVVKSAVNIDRRLKLMGDIEGDSSGTPPHNDPPCCVCNLAASARSAESSFSETDEATEQLHTKYLASLSLLEQRVCSIARDHLESSFDLSRSTGFVAWVGKK
jgi:hypothetical protein